MFLVLHINFAHKQNLVQELVSACTTLADLTTQQTLAMEAQRQQGGSRATQYVRDVFSKYGPQQFPQIQNKPAAMKELGLLDLSEAPRFFFQFPVAVMSKNYSAGADDAANGKSIDSRTSVKSDVKRQAEGECQICGEGGVSAAHILKTHAACSALGVEYDEGSNYLALCGREGDLSSCHDAFDKGRVSFIHTEGEEWMIVGGKKHGTTVTFPQKPHRRTLHTHLAWCVSQQTLCSEGDKKDEINEWLKGVEGALQEDECALTPPDSPEKEEEEEGKEETNQKVLA